MVKAAIRTKVHECDATMFNQGSIAGYKKNKLCT